MESWHSHKHVFFAIFRTYFPRGDPGVQDENGSSVSPACHKRRLNGAVSRNNYIKRAAPCRCLDGHVELNWLFNVTINDTIQILRLMFVTGTLKNPTKYLWCWEPDRRFNFFNLPEHLCTVTHITEISLHVTLSNQSHSLTQSYFFFDFEAKSRKYQRVFEVKSRVKTWQVRRIWSQQLEH